MGVEYKQNTKKETEHKRAFAKYIIANAAVLHVAQELLPREEGKKIRKRIENLHYAPSLFNVYMGFNASLKQYGVNHYTTVVCDESCKTIADIYKNTRVILLKETLFSSITGKSILSWHPRGNLLVRFVHLITYQTGSKGRTEPAEKRIRSGIVLLLRNDCN